MGNKEGWSGLRLDSCGEALVTLGFSFPRKKRPDPVSVGSWPGKGPDRGSGSGGESSLLCPLLSPSDLSLYLPRPQS